SDTLEIKQGIATGGNDLFVRFFWEIDFDSFAVNIIPTTPKTKKWYKYDKGGGYRKYFGNNLFVINWENDGYEIRNIRNEKGKIKSRPQNIQYQFLEGFTFNLTGKISYRYKEYGHVFDVQGSSVFYSKEESDLKFFYLALLNSKLSSFFSELTNPTMVTQVGDVSKIPLIRNPKKEEDLGQIGESNVAISMDDWNKYETSWDFLQNELIRLNKEENLSRSE